MADYQEAILTLPSECVHNRGKLESMMLDKLTDYPDVAYAMLGATYTGEAALALRAEKSTLMPSGVQSHHRALYRGMAFLVRADFCPAHVDRNRGNVIETWKTLLNKGGFSSQYAYLTPVNTLNTYKHNSGVRINYWSVQDHVRVTDADKAVQTMIHGIGDNRSTGFGMIIEVGMLSIVNAFCRINNTSKQEIFNAQ